LEALRWGWKEEILSLRFFQPDLIGLGFKFLNAFGMELGKERVEVQAVSRFFEILEQPLEGIGCKRENGMESLLLGFTLSLTGVLLSLGFVELADYGLEIFLQGLIVVALEEEISATLVFDLETDSVLSETITLTIEFVERSDII
jgi:hypothetical protein